MDSNNTRPKMNNFLFFLILWPLAAVFVNFYHLAKPSMARVAILLAISTLMPIVLLAAAIAIFPSVDAQSPSWTRLALISIGFYLSICWSGCALTSVRIYDMLKADPERLQRNSSGE